jgi:ribonucleoside-diphosphate reductase alpha chain
MEITLPTKSLNNILDEEGEIALCTLMAVNVGLINDFKELENIMDICVRSLDELLDYQNYPVKAAEISTKNRRSLGIGITNFAYFLAKNGVKYSDGSANQLTHDLFEHLQYYGLKASCNLAKEKGACGYFDQTNYAKGLLPIDTYKKTVDDLVKPEYKLDWEWLRGEIKKYGLRNSTITALMPCETSSQVTNSTNGIEPPRGLVSVKASKDGLMKQVVPDIERLANNYEKLWDFPSNKGYIDLVSIMQKFVDQSISANTSYDPEKFEDNKVPVKVILKDMAYAYRMGVKTLYYHNTRDHANSSYKEKESNCIGGACSI